jgi:hypothetical protein
MDGYTAHRRGIVRKMPLAVGDVVTYPYYREGKPPAQEGREWRQKAYAICDGDYFFTTRRNAIVITTEAPPAKEVLRTGQVIAQVWESVPAPQEEQEAQE